MQGHFQNRPATHSRRVSSPFHIVPLPFPLLSYKNNNNIVKQPKPYTARNPASSWARVMSALISPLFHHRGWNRFQQTCLPVLLLHINPSANRGELERVCVCVCVQASLPAVQRWHAQGQLRGQALHQRHPQQDPRSAGLHLPHHRLLRHQGRPSAHRCVCRRALKNPDLKGATHDVRF